MSEGMQHPGSDTMRPLARTVGHRAPSFLLLGAAVALSALLALGTTLATAVPPVATMGTASNVGYTTAEVSGTIDPEDNDTFYFFQYAVAGTDHGVSGEEGWTDGDFLGPLAASSGATPVADDLIGLQADTTYEVRLRALNFVDPDVPSPNVATFTTADIVSPTATIDSITEVTGSSATFSGQVEPNAPGPAPQDPDYDVDWRFECDPGCPALPGEQTIAGDDGSHAVQAEAGGLEPNTTYTVTLRAANAGRTGTDTETFTTDAVPPSAITLPNIPKGGGEVLLRGRVNPRNSQVTECRFEYGPTTAYGQSAPCEGDPGAGGEAVDVSAKLSGLTPGATYRYRLLAAGAAGTGAVEGVFVAPAAPQPSPTGPFPGQGFLPDGRAWEMVSPPDKNGADIAADSRRTRAAADGDAVGFISLGAFGDAIGTGIATDYVARRSSDADPGDNGWSTHAITPKNAPISLEQIFAALTPHYQGEYSPDLDAGIFFSHSPLSDDPTTANALNIYRRDDLLTPGAGSYELVSGCPGCETSGPLPVTAIGSHRPMLAGASPDFEHVIFESEHPLTDDTPAISDRVRLYEWSEEDGVQLAGRVPTGGAEECDDAGAPTCAPAEVSLAGQGAGSPNTTATHVESLTFHTVSDGSDSHRRVFFTVPTDGSGTTIVPQGLEGNLYMRIDGHRTVKLNASERSSPSTFAPASYWDATPDGTRVYLSTAEPLTDDAPDNGAAKLYMYDTTKPASDDNLTLMYTDRFPADPGTLIGLIGTSTDGSYVYFIAVGQLVNAPDAPQLNNRRGIYLWHEGEVSFIGSLPNSPSLVNEQMGAGTPSNYLVTSRQARVPPNGKHVIFSSRQSNGLTSANHGSCIGPPGLSCRHLYVYSAETDALQCASCRPDGTAPSTDADTIIRKLAGGAATSWHQTNALSNDGKVFFTSEERLVAEDRNGVADAYVFDSATGKPKLLSSGEDPSPSYFLDASPDGRDAFFTTRERLSGWDVDESYDLYDARAGGGFPEPPPPPPACEGDACQPAPLVLNDPTPASSGFRGAGDPKADRGKARKNRCPRGKRRVTARGGKSRCVTRKKARRRQKRGANADGRAGR